MKRPLLIWNSFNIFISWKGNCNSCLMIWRISFAYWYSKKTRFKRPLLSEEQNFNIFSIHYRCYECLCMWNHLWPFMGLQKSKLQKNNIAVQQPTSNIPCKANKIVFSFFAFFGEIKNQGLNIYIFLYEHIASS